MASIKKYNSQRALQNNLAKIHNARNYMYGDDFKLKLCTQNMEYTNFERIFPKNPSNRAWLGVECFV